MATAERIIECRDESVGLTGVIVIDDTTRGPGLGGIRMRPYPSFEDAVEECRRLAAGMTLKNAVAELPFGGAKSVVLGDGSTPDRTALMRRFGEFVASTGGDYLPGVDMGTTTRDLALVASSGADVSCSDEDPSPWTAAGTHAAIAAAAAHVLGASSLEGVSVLVQGAGHVGGALAAQLALEGAEVIVADADAARADEVAAASGARVIDPAEVIGTPCDVYAPCAIARVLSRATIARLDCRIVAGAANEMLDGAGCDELLAERGIAYVPDFVANAGGVIHIHALRCAWDVPRLRLEIERIGERVTTLLERSERAGTTPLAEAHALAERRLRRGAREETAA
jgi:leucine dehydrogenase